MDNFVVIQKQINDNNVTYSIIDLGNNYADLVNMYRPNTNIPLQGITARNYIYKLYNEPSICNLFEGYEAICGEE